LKQLQLIQILRINPRSCVIAAFAALEECCVNRHQPTPNHGQAAPGGENAGVSRPKKWK
jgi:hypothetical protein